MSLRPFFSFYGSKWSIAPKYPEPDYETIIEPFAGSAGYSLRYYQKQVILYDLDPIICGIWNFLIKATPNDITNLPAEVVSVDDLPSTIPQEAKWLIGFWLGHGSAMPKKTLTTWGHKYKDTSNLFWGERVKKRLLKQINCIRHWKCLEKSFENIDDLEDVTWFIDPPYEFGGQHYRFSSKAIDYETLGKWCQNRVGQVIVCESPLATWLDFKPFLTARSTKFKYSQEALWYITDKEIETAYSSFEGLFEY